MASPSWAAAASHPYSNLRGLYAPPSLFERRIKMKIKINNNMISEEVIFFIPEFINKFRKETAPGWYMLSFDITDKTVTVEIERSVDKRKVTLTTNRGCFTSSDEMSGVYWTIKDDTDTFELLIREPITKLWRLFKKRRLDYQEALKELLAWQSESAKATWQTAALSDD
jgi:hypothetical protein